MQLTDSRVETKMMCLPNTDPSLSSPSDEVRKAMAAGWHLRNQDRRDEAARMCHEILSDRPDFGEAWHLLGVLALDHGDHDQAVANLEHAIAVEPHQPLHYNNLGVAKNEMRLYEQAAGFLRKALELDPGYTDARCNLGLSHFHLNQLPQAVKCFEKVLSVHPEHEAALANLGMTRLAQQKYAEAVSAYEKAIAVDPSRPAWHGNLGAAYLRSSRFNQAVLSYRRAIKLAPTNIDYHVHLGIVQRAAGDLPGSINALETALSLEPRHSKALANLVVALEYICQWDQLDALYPVLDQITTEALKNGVTPDEDPMLNIRRCADLKTNRSVAQAWSQSIHDRSRRILPQFSHQRSGHDSGRITLGYLSYDFRNHPVSHQLYPLFGLHDRSRFRVIAFSMGPDDSSEFRREVEAGCDEFIDIGHLGLEQAAQAVYDRDVDILVDLMGHTHHNRMEILALRPAPIQMSYLGFLSTSGSEDIDYVVADRIVVPPGHQRYYSERLLRMPGCYQMNHAQLTTGPADGQRSMWGLPENAFVYACFNNTYKIDARLFDAWMRILHRTPSAVLWLSGAHQVARTQMRSRARMAEIEPQRLIFAEKIPLQDHLRRLPLADLALDTLRYNGGATTANALGVGLPVITVMGRHWVSRMAASHLIAAGMPDLVFNELSSYEEAAVNLARNPDHLRTLKQRLAGNLKTHSLFDTPGFVRHLETGFKQIWRRHLQGHKPCDMDIPKGPARIYNE